MSSVGIMAGSPRLTDGRMIRQGHLQRAFTVSLVLPSVVPSVLTPATIFVMAPLCSRLPRIRTSMSSRAAKSKIAAAVSRAFKQAGASAWQLFPP